MLCDNLSLANMSSRKTDSSAFQPVVIKSRQRYLTLPPGAVRIRRNGLEFESHEPFPLWVEMTVELEAPKDGKRVCCNGVVVACDGNRHKGYLVMLHLTGLTNQAQASLNHLATSIMA